MDRSPDRAPRTKESGKRNPIVFDFALKVDTNRKKIQKETHHLWIKCQVSLKPFITVYVFQVKIEPTSVIFIPL